MNKDTNNLAKQYQLISEADFTLGPRTQGRDFDQMEEVRTTKVQTYIHYQKLVHKFMQAAEELHDFMVEANQILDADDDVDLISQLETDSTYPYYDDFSIAMDELGEELSATDISKANFSIGNFPYEKDNP